MITDSRQLLVDYVENRSETAFRELVTSHIDLVYSTALRLVNGDAHQAQDVAQTVFMDLARHARKLGGDTMLGGWLHRDMCFVAAKLMRTDRRRRKREMEATEMNALNNADQSLEHVAPILDEAINQLGDKDRKAILLRFYEGRDSRSVGEILGSSENAAQKRVTRALEQLRLMLTSRGVSLSAAALGAALASEAVSAAPAGLAAIIAGPAWAGAGGGSGAVTETLFKVMTMTKLKFSILSALMLAAVVGPLTVQHQSYAKLREENRALRQQLEQSAELMAANQRLSNLLVAQASGRQPMADEQFRELLRLYLDAVEHAGIRVLNNEKVEINGLQIIGVHDAELHAPPLFRALLQGARVDRNRPSILLAHQPLNLSIPEEEGVSLQLSGHTHGGQLWPWTWVAARVHGRFNRGLNQFGKLLVLTSNGVGTWGAPMRVGTKSEIVLIRLAPV